MTLMSRLADNPLKTAALVATLVTVVKWILGISFFPPEALAQNAWSFGYEEGNIAANLAAGNGFSMTTEMGNSIPTAWVSPLYPIILAEVFGYCGLFTLQAAKVVIAINCVVQGLTAAMLYLLGRRLHSSAVGIVATGLYLLNPNAWQFLGWAWHTQIYAMLLLLHVLVLFWRTRSVIVYGATVGATLALALLADGAAIMVLPVTVAHLFLSSKKKSKSCLRVVAAFVSLGLVLLPWTLRNHQAFGSMNPLRGNASIQVWLGNHPDNRQEAFHGLTKSPWHDSKELALLVQSGEAQYARICRKRVFERMICHPGRFCADTALRVTGYWFGEWWIGFAHIPWYVTLGQITFSALAFAGMWRCRKLDIRLLFAVFVLFPIPYYVAVLGHGRYRAPIEPLICLFGAFLFVRMNDHNSKPE